MMLYGIFGYPLAHTLSPAMHEAGFDSLKIPAKYIALQLDKHNFRKVMGRLNDSPLSGFNLTVPYKEEVTRYLHQLTPEAKAVGAVNTVYRRGSKWVGTNTDVYGFKTALVKEGKFRGRGKTALVIGAGGAARAVVQALTGLGVKKIFVANRHKSRALKLVRQFAPKNRRIRFEALPLKGKAVKEALLSCDLAVNATSAGLKKSDPALLAASAVPKASQRSILFYDLIYDPAETKFLRLAKSKGQKTLSGLGMLFYQGVGAFESWTGKRAPEKVMRKALVQALRERGN